MKKTKKIEKLEKKLEEAYAELDEARRKSMIECMHCERRTRVSKLTYIQTHWYVRPYSCTGGDYWKQGEGQFVCPKCGETNRLYERKVHVWSEQYKSKGERENRLAERANSLKYFFKEIEETYDH